MRPAAGLYRAHMGSDHEAEIRASVGAHDELGPGYDDAQDGGRAALALLIWAAIAIVNIAYARRC